MTSTEMLLQALAVALRKGGPGSGNFDHVGIPGQQGGSVSTRDNATTVVQGVPHKGFSIPHRVGATGSPAAQAPAKPAAAAADDGPVTIMEAGAKGFSIPHKESAGDIKPTPRVHPAPATGSGGRDAVSQKTFQNNTLPLRAKLKLGDEVTYIDHQNKIITGRIDFGFTREHLNVELSDGTKATVPKAHLRMLRSAYRTRGE